MTIYLNHVGFLLRSRKTLLLGGLIETEFTIHHQANAGTVYPQ